MTAWWHRYEGPTWVVAFAIYGGWLGLAANYRHVPVWIALPVAVYLTAWHSSLAHETIHAMRRVPRGLRTLIAAPPLGIWFPYTLYRREHIEHHRVRDLTGPADPESFFIEPVAWARLSPPLRAVYTANQTLGGRIVLGPALVLWRTLMSELGRIRAGDYRNVPLWSLHVAVTAALLALLDRCTGIAPWLYLSCVAYPALSLTLIRSFAEHRAGAEPAQRTATVESALVRPARLLARASERRASGRHHLSLRLSPNLPNLAVSPDRLARA
jgi:fatty acid desaturase